ncbi:MAG TPA: Glu-tRNA(Gln) amidotransferase subunit GatE [Nitrososphaerales archaeon]|nr:Glu-tRNA(Gln) amidotransferase subunit GatE [Nitrososphaerales archaeon]
MEFDPAGIGLRVGIEIHQQLATSTKLFCACPVMKSEEFPYQFRRRLRPSQSEVGRLDPAAVFEFSKGRTNLYLWSPESSCLVEADEEPPHRMNEDAVDSAVTVALLLGSNVVDEVHVMRKIVIDGSNTTGFQRTCVVGLGGKVLVDGKAVGVQSVTLEEDAARILGEDQSERRYGLDRLGVPLVEVALEPFTGTPEMVGNLALHLGRALRSTGRVARGLGTIRQDLNVSVGGGKVIEVKGVQKLNLVQKVVAYEAARQLALMKLAEKVKALGPGPLRCTVSDCTGVLSGTASKVLKRLLADGGKVVCVCAPRLGGLLGWEPFPGVRLGREVAEVARANSLGGVIHSDEFAKQGVSKAEEAALRKKCGAPAGSALVLVAGEPSRVERAVEPIVERLEKASEGVPAETRGATEEGETRYLRPRPGAQRMYPETDIPDIVVTREALASLESRLPERWDARVGRYEKEFSLSRDLAFRLYDSGYAPLFESLAPEAKIAPSVLAATLVDLPVRLVREGVPEEKVDDALLVSVARAMGDGRVAKEAAFDVALLLGSGRAKSIDDALRDLGLKAMSRDELESEIDRIIAGEASLVKEKGEAAFSPLMGRVMERARGRADGQVVSRLLKQKLKSAVRDQ